MAVRVDQLVPYGYTDTAISTFHAFGDRIIREYALELGLPTDLRVLTRAEVVIFLREHLFEFELDAYRPLGDPTRFLAALAALFSRCKDEDIAPADFLAHADRVAAEAARVAEAAGVDPVALEAAAAADEAARRQAELARAYATYQALHGRQRLHRLRRPGGARPPARPHVGVGPDGDRRPLPVHPRRRVPGHQPRPGRARGRARRRAPQRDGRGRRRPGDLRVPRRGGGQHPRPSRTATSARGPSSCGATTGRSRRSSTPRTGSSGSTTRTGWRSGPASSKRLRPQRVSPVARARPARGLRARARRRRTGSPPRSAGGSRTAPRPAIMPSWSGPTAMPTRSCARSTWPASRGGSRARPGCTPGPRCGCCSRSCASSADLDSSVDVYALAASDIYRLGGEDLTAIVTMARRRNRSIWAVARGARPAAGDPAGRPRDPRGRPQARRRPAPVRPGGPRAAGRRAAVPVPARERPAGAPGRRRTRRPPRSSSRTSPGSSRSSDRSRRCSPTIAPSFVAPPPGDAHRGGRRPGHGRARSRRGRGRRADRPQGQGPRVPGGVPARPGRRPVPDVAVGRSRWRCRPGWVAASR